MRTSHVNRRREMRSSHFAFQREAQSAKFAFQRERVSHWGARTPIMDTKGPQNETKMSPEDTKIPARSFAKRVLGEAVDLRQSLGSPRRRRRCSRRRCAPRATSGASGCSSSRSSAAGGPLSGTTRWPSSPRWPGRSTRWTPRSYHLQNAIKNCALGTPLIVPWAQFFVPRPK